MYIDSASKLDSGNECVESKWVFFRLLCPLYADILFALIYELLYIAWLQQNIYIVCIAITKN